jgi:Icc-related predicted phosphoesterase
MRCLVVGDLHYSLPQYDWVVQEAPRFDLVIIAGDHLDLSSPVDGRAQTVVIQKYLELLSTKVKVVTCSGNHDLDSRNEEGEKTASWIAGVSRSGVSTDGETIAFDGKMISICAWWDGPKARERIEAQLKRDAERREGPWIWVHHAPAANSPTSWGGSRSHGDDVLTAWIDQHQPDMVLSGHIHQAPFVNAGSWVDRIGKTLVFNMGQHLGAPPPHIVFDTTLGEAAWLSAAGFQAIKLDQAIERPLKNLASPPLWVNAAKPLA